MLLSLLKYYFTAVDMQRELISLQSTGSAAIHHLRQQHWPVSVCSACLHVHQWSRVPLRCVAHTAVSYGTDSAGRVDVCCVSDHNFIQPCLTLRRVRRRIRQVSISGSLTPHARPTGWQPPTCHLYCIDSENSLPSTVNAIVAVISFALLHVLLGRHDEYILRLDYIWRHEEMVECQKAQDMVTLHQGVIENNLPAHVLWHYQSPECVMVGLCSTLIVPPSYFTSELSVIMWQFRKCNKDTLVDLHRIFPVQITKIFTFQRPYSHVCKSVGVAVVTIPNFPAFVNEMCSVNQSLAVLQVAHDITSAFDHVSPFLLSSLQFTSAVRAVW